MAHDVEFVEQDRRLRRPFARRVAKRLPHVHHRQANAVALLLAQPVVELRHARLRAILPAEPDRPAADQVAHHDTVAMALADRDLIDADRLGPRPARAGELGLHVLLLQRLDRIPVELQLLGNVLDRRLPTALAHVMGKALRIERVVRQEIEPLALHLAATAASHPPDLNLQEDARVAARQIANPPYTPVVPTQMNPPAAPAGRFFARRASVMRRAFGSPKIPRTVGWGRKPGNVYVSHRRRRRFDELAIATSCPIQSPYETQKTQYPWGFKPHFPLVSSTRFPDEPKNREGCVLLHEVVDEPLHVSDVIVWPVLNRQPPKGWGAVVVTFSSRCAS